MTAIPSPHPRQTRLPNSSRSSIAGMPGDDTADRTAPVIVLCGTPGTGKSTTAQLLVSESPIPLKHINVGDLVKEKGLHEGYDPEWQSYTVDDDKVK